VLAKDFAECAGQRIACEQLQRWECDLSRLATPSYVAMRKTMWLICLRINVNNVLTPCEHSDHRTSIGVLWIAGCSARYARTEAPWLRSGDCKEDSVTLSIQVAKFATRPEHASCLSITGNRTTRGRAHSVHSALVRRGPTSISHEHGTAELPRSPPVPAHGKARSISRTLWTCRWTDLPDQPQAQIRHVRDMLRA
jgi:hypothetical protein